MKISELIAKLTEAKEVNGDIEVGIMDDQWPEPIVHADVWELTDDGNQWHPYGFLQDAPEGTEVKPVLILGRKNYM